MNQTHKITLMLRQWSDGNREALDGLLPMVYDELHKQAARYLRRERPGNTLQTTGLIHETYIRLVDQPAVNYKNRLHFFAISANLMRQVLVDHARSKYRIKRGGNVAILPLNEETAVAGNEQSLDVIALDEALNRLAEIDERQVRVVELRYFSGLTLEETAEALDVSRTTVATDWKMAKAWIHRELTR
jgi:RNA polymerase sigma factor (TIGR02999 family)